MNFQGYNGKTKKVQNITIYTIYTIKVKKEYSQKPVVRNTVEGKRKL